ncbi:hypothetical protein [Rubinisphaera italica]|uniref:Uncharacterized protein n=1 Tax=Rubinisphaera italica TaxID=2527969 RepID=A0A5C5XJD6_9PLAN|nr:hypothetical protein [Rubinisphaera italica]TWT62838.1 hypothetical protein Pan54_35840 [Rubinisphaera italica]
MHWVGFLFVFVVLSLRNPELFGVGLGLVGGYSLMYFFYRLLGGKEGPLK